MTVGIAALCKSKSVDLGEDNSPDMILAASDRKFTSGGIEYEHSHPKKWELTANVQMLVSGDIEAHTEIWTATVKEMPETQPQTVLEVASLYSKHFDTYCHKQRQRGVLQKLGLDYDSFIARQDEMSADFVQLRTEELRNYDLELESLVIGCDLARPHTPHIYHITEDDGVIDKDEIGFAGIGTGGELAELQFMFARYSPFWTQERALLLLYQAKKIAQHAQGVGRRTDVFRIGPWPGRGYVRLTTSKEKELYGIYREIRKRQAEVEKGRREDVSKILTDENTFEEFLDGVMNLKADVEQEEEDDDC